MPVSTMTKETLDEQNISIEMTERNALIQKILRKDGLGIRQLTNREKNMLCTFVLENEPTNTLAYNILNDVFETVSELEVIELAYDARRLS